MASMTVKERAEQYYQRLLASVDKKSELEKILNDLNSLVLTASGEPLNSATKIRIIEEFENLVKSSISLEHLHESRASYRIKKSYDASDNGDILDVISAMKRKVG